MRNVVWLISGYAAVSMLAPVAVNVFRHDATMVTNTVWIRGTVVAPAMPALVVQINRRPVVRP